MTDHEATPKPRSFNDALFRSLFERMDDGFCLIRVIFDTTGSPVDYEFVVTNPAFTTHTGLQDAVGRRIREMVPDLDASWFQRYGHVAATGESMRFENEAPAMRRWFEVSADRVGNPEERLVGVVFRDVTRRKQAEAALRESEARARETAERAERDRRLLDAVLDAAPVGIIVADASGRLLRMNAANARVWGVAPLSSSVDEYGDWKGWWADRSARSGRQLEPRDWAMARALQGEVVTSDLIEIEPFDAPGMRRTILNSGAPVRDSSGTVLGAVVAQMDITERTQAERALRAAQDRATAAEREAAQTAERERQRLSALFMQAPVAIAIVRGPRFVIELANAQVLELWGRSAEEVLGKPAFEVFPDAAEGFEGLVRQVQRTGERFVGVEAPVRLSPNAEERFLNLVYEPLREPDGTIDAVMAVAVDVTESVRARRRVEQLRAQAEEAVRVRDEFLSVASHELKTPLTSLSLKLDTAARGAAAGKATDEKTWELMRRQVRRLSALVEDLLDVSRISTGRLQLERDAVDLSELARELGARFLHDAERAGSVLTIEAAGSVVGLWDRVRLEQVVSNLLSNAIKYGAGKPITLEVTADDRLATLVVQDRGIGFAPDALPRIFNKFERAVSDRHYGGLGLGLFITRQIVEAMGGSIRAESTPDQGARFTVELPRQG